MRSTSLMCITLAALLAVTLGMRTAAAEVVYTPVNVTISGNGYIKIDLNHDGITDFVLHSASQATVCGMLGRSALQGSTKITPTTGDGVRVSNLDFAAVLASGISIDASETFYKAQTIVTQYFICWGSSRHVAGYLGLEFQLNGQTHYGWAQVSIDAYDNWRGIGMHTTLIGFAYETTPGQAITTGQTSGAVALVTPLAAQQQAARHHNYKVIDVGTLGGPTSGFNFNSRIINRKGVAVGGADTAVFDPNCGCFVAHGFRWEDGLLTDLGPLPGGANTFAIAINSRGAVAGISENGLIDPITGTPAFVATIWKNGQITDLGTFGGSFSLPNDINSRGQAAGGAEDTTPDAFDFGGNTLGLPSPTQWHATLWQHGTMQNLGTLGDGLDSFALFVNEPGQAAGFSFTNSVVNPATGIPTVDPFFWENGQMVDLGTLGGVFGTVSGLNNRGQVIGASNLAGDLKSHPFSWYGGVLTDIGTLGGDNGSATWVNDAGEVVGGADLPGSQTHHAYLWKNGVMKDLGTVGTGPCSRADSINEREQIVGESTHVCGGHDSVAFLWENGGPMIDLNSFAPPGSGIVLNDAAFINERGEIAVDGRLNGDHHAFVLVPDGDCDDDCESRIAANQNNIVPIQNSTSTKSGIDSPADRVSEFRNRRLPIRFGVGDAQRQARTK